MKFFSKSKWRKVIIHAAFMDWKEFDQLGWTLADDAADKLNVPLFFCRYSSADTCRIEIQLQSEHSDAALIEFFGAYPHVIGVALAASGGSDAHATAYVLSRFLRGKGEPHTKDVMHWLLNMAGYSYPQEIRLMCENAAKMAENMEKVS